ncbi:MAG: TMEM175 family protein [Bryocella sp.]
MPGLHEYIAKDGFRLRGTTMSRIDGFSDVVFGFALTLLIVSLEVPKTYIELRNVLIGFIPFSVCFVFLIMIWWAHFRFFRRYGLHDPATIVINACLLFTVLFYVYPLKFLFGIAISDQNTSSPIFTGPLQGRHLMVIYALGFAAIYLTLAALYFNAWRQRRHLHLNPLETTLTLVTMTDVLGVSCVGVLSAIVAVLLPPDKSGYAGYFFFTIGIWKTIHGTIAGKRTRMAQARTLPSERKPLPHSM